MYEFEFLEIEFLLTGRGARLGVRVVIVTVRLQALKVRDTDVRLARVPGGV